MSNFYEFASSNPGLAFFLVVVVAVTVVVVAVTIEGIVGHIAQAVRRR